MNLEQINDAIRTAGERVRDLSARLALAATQAAPNMDDVTRLQTELQQESARLNALRDSAAALGGQQQGLQPAPQGLTPAQERSQSEIRKSNEYARAFAFALRKGISPDSGHQYAEKLKPLYDALSIGGGTTPGEDGGFLVPEDIDHSIRELQRELNPLRQYFSVEGVNTQSGWRVADNAPTTGFTQVDELSTVPKDDQPAFAKISYALVKYGLILPISRELANDEVANLFGYLARWGAKKELITENTLLLAALNALSSAVVTIEAGQELKGLKKILNVSLDPAISRNSVILTNQNGFNLLDSMEDLNGRPILQWDPVSQTPRAFGGKRVESISNAVLPNITAGSGQTATEHAPFFLGDGREFATLFERSAMEILSTNIGGNTFYNDSIEIRYLKRMGVSTFDMGAMKMAKALI